MATIGELTSGLTSKISFAGLGKGITFMLGFLVFAIIIGVLTYFIIMTIRFNKRIVIFENISGQGFTPTGKDRAMTLKFGDGGEEILKLRKRNVLKQAYGRKMGKNTYWFVIGGDGYWYNATLEDFDNKLKKLGVNPIDRDIRYMNVAIRRNIKDRFDQVTFLQKYGGLIAFSALIIIMSVGFWFVTRELKETASILANSMNTAKEVLDASKNILVANDNILSSGGIKPA